MKLKREKKSIEGSLTKVSPTIIPPSFKHKPSADIRLFIAIKTKDHQNQL